VPERCRITGRPRVVERLSDAELECFACYLKRSGLEYRLILSHGPSHSDSPTSPRPERGRSEYSPDVLHRQAGCWQPQRSSVCWPALLQCSLQYFPYGPFFGTTHWQLGWAHLFASAMSESPRRHSTPLKEGSQRLRQQPSHEGCPSRTLNSPGKSLFPNEILAACSRRKWSVDGTVLSPAACWSMATFGASSA
jgi:hypothetical protein